MPHSAWSKKKGLLLLYWSGLRFSDSRILNSAHGSWVLSHWEAWHGVQRHAAHPLHSALSCQVFCLRAVGLGFTNFWLHWMGCAERKVWTLSTSLSQPFTTDLVQWNPILQWHTLKRYTMFAILCSFLGVRLLQCNWTYRATLFMGLKLPCLGQLS